MKESATQLISKSGLTLGKIFALVAKSGRQRLQKELTKLQNYSSYYSQLAQERSKNNKNERFYSDKYLQGYESFSYIISLQKKFYLRQQPPYKTLLTSKKREKSNNNTNFAGGIGGPNMYDDIMNIDKKSKNDNNGNGAAGSSQTLHFQKEYESIFEIILSNYEKYMKDYISNNKYISFKIRAYTQSVVKLKPINKRNPLYNRINHTNYNKEQVNRQKIIQQNQSLDNISQIQNNQQQSIQRTNAASTSNLDRLMPPTFDFNSRNNQIKNSPSKNQQRQFQSISLNPVIMDPPLSNNFRKRNLDSSQSNNNSIQGGQNQQQSYQMQNYSNTNTNQQTAAKKFQMPTAPIFLSNTLNINNNNNNNQHSSISNRDISEDCSSQLNPNEEVLSNNGLPSYTEIATVNDQQNSKNAKSSQDNYQREKEEFIRPLSYQIKNPNDRYKLRQESPQLVQNIIGQQQVQQPYLRRESEDRILNQRRLSKKNIDYQGSLDAIDQASMLPNNLQSISNQRKSVNNILQITNQSVLNVTQDINKQIPSNPSIAAVLNEESTKNSQNALADIQQIVSEPKIPTYPVSSQIPPSNFASLTSLDFTPQQKDFFQVQSTQAASLQQQSQGNEQTYPMIQNYRSQFPMTGNILLKKNKSPNSIEDLQQMQRILNGVSQQLGQQQQQQIQQQQQQIVNNLNNNNLNMTGTNSSMNMNNSNIFPNNPASVNQQRLMQQYQQQQQTAKRAAALLSQNMPPVQNMMNFSVQNMLLNNNNGFSSTKNTARNSQQLQFGMQNFPENNMMLRQSLNLPLQQQQQQQQQSFSQANLEDQNSIINTNTMKMNPRQSRTNQLLIQSQQFSNMVQNNILTQQLQMQQLQRDTLQQKYMQQQQQQQQLLLQQQQQSMNPAAFFQSPSQSNSMQLNSLTQLPAQKKQFGQQQFGLINNQQQSPSQIFMPQLAGAQPNQSQQQYPLSQHNLFQTQSLQQLPANNSNQMLQFPNTNQQQGYIQAMNSTASQLAQTQTMLNLQNIMSQKYISQEINFKKLRGSLSNNPKQVSQNLLAQNNNNEGTIKGSRHRKKYLGNAYHLNGTSNLTNGNGLLGEITKITEENTGSNILEKRDINSASSAYRKQNDGLDIKSSTTRNYLNLKLSTVQNEYEDKNLTEQEVDMFSKTQTAMKNFVISPPRKVIASKGSKRQTNEGEASDSFQNNPLQNKKPSLSNISMVPVSIQQQQN